MNIVNTATEMSPSSSLSQDLQQKQVQLMQQQQQGQVSMPPMPNQQLQMPPMPSQQLQQAMMQQQPYIIGQTANSHFMTTFRQSMGSNSKNIVAEDLDEKKIKLQNEVIGNFTTNELRKDYETVKGMNVVDSIDDLDCLFLSSPSLVNKGYKLKLIAQLYYEKYPEIYAKYPSMHVYTTYCLSMIIFNNISYLKHSCETRTVRVPMLGSSFKLTRSQRKRKHEDCDDSQKTLPGGKTSKFTHPFLEHEAYKSCELLYNLGKCTDICQPSEFAILFTDTTIGKLNKMESNNPLQYTGIRITFTMPIVCIVKSRKNKDFIFNSVEHLKNVGDFLSSLTSLMCAPDTFSWGNKRSLKCRDIVENTISDVDLKKTYDNGFAFVIVSSLNCFQLSNKTLSARTYSDSVYFISSNIVDGIESVLKDCESVNNDQCDKLQAILEKYDKDIATESNATQQATTITADDDDEN